MRNNIKVLHLRAGSFYGGPERQLHMHALKARKLGVDITIGSFTEGGKPPQFLGVIARDRIKTHIFEVKNAYDPSVIYKVKEFLGSKNIDILCTHDYRTQVIGLLAIRNIDTKWLAFSRGWTKENMKIRCYNILDKIIIRFANHIVAVSHSQKKKLHRLLIPNERISVIHNAVQPEYFKDELPVNLHQLFGFPTDACICVSAGRFSAEKGQTFLVKAAAIALTNNSSLRFILWGTGPELTKIRRLISTLGMDDVIICPGFEKKLIGCLKGADILINPSLSEGLPNIVLEAMALKIPVLATSVGGVPEAITDRANGCLVPVGDVQALASGILFLSSKNNQLPRLTKAAMETLKSKFTFENQNQELNSVYHKLLSHKQS